MSLSRPMRLPRRWLLLGAAAAATSTAHARAGEESRWDLLAEQIFDGRPLQDGAAVLALEAPYRAEDAALVPITIRVLPDAAGHSRIRRITLVIDGNPSPLAATFAPGPHTDLHAISTRVRVDSYTDMHAVAEHDDGTLHVVQRFVKAAGGCSAPATKQVASDVPLGTMRFRQFRPLSDTPDLREAQLMIRHPNYSGMQMDQITRFYVPAQFVATVRIWQGEELLLDIESGISISENPEYRFVFRPHGNAVFRAEATDSDDRRFRGEWPAATT